uniref:Rhodanese domain-containing protein n=1 Tax=Caenorhabditis tropicalis TaxID=1561998 RepID=A0A1I7TAA0_9PELO
MTQVVNDCLSKNDNLQEGKTVSFESEAPVQTPVRRYSLPTVDSPQRESSTFRSISAAVLASLLRNHSSYLQLIIFDCRYPFEYFGGHIKVGESFRFGKRNVMNCLFWQGAVNIYSFDNLEKYLFDEFGVRSTMVGLTPIFYCEYSQVRGPAMARRLRRIEIHRKNHLSLEFPEIYLLDKGYVNFWSDPSLRDLCEPRYYISMHARPYKHALRQYTQHRSKSTANENKTKKNSLRVFSSEDLLSDVPEKVLEKVVEERTPRQPRARTPRARLLFE